MVTIHFTIHKLFKKNVEDEYYYMKKDFDDDDNDLLEVKINKSSLQQRIRNGNLSFVAEVYLYKKVNHSIQRIRMSKVYMKNITVIEPYVLFTAKAKLNVDCYEILNIQEINILPLRATCNSIIDNDVSYTWIKTLLIRELGCSKDQCKQIIDILAKKCNNDVIKDKHFGELPNEFYNKIYSRSIYFLHKQLIDALDKYESFITIDKNKFYRKATPARINELKTLLSEKPWNIILKKKRKEFCITKFDDKKFKWDIKYNVALICQKIINQSLDNGDMYYILTDFLCAIIQKIGIYNEFNEFIKKIRTKEFIFKKKNIDKDKIVSYVYSPLSLKMTCEKSYTLIISAIEWLFINDEILLIKDPIGQEIGNYEPQYVFTPIMSNCSGTDRVYLTEELEAQSIIVDKIAHVFKKKGIIRSKNWKQDLRKHEINPNEEQLEAIYMALNNPYTCILGEGGCGKTFTLKSIIKCLDKPGINILICSAYGKSENVLKRNLFKNGVKNEFEFANVKIYTIDMANTLSKNIFNIEFQKFLSGVTHLIIDESQNNSTILKSKVYSLMDSSLESIIEFGDIMQIEPIGRGFPYGLIANQFPQFCTNLTKNMRVTEENSMSIINNCRLIRNKDIDIVNKLEDDINTGTAFITVGDKDEIVKEILDIYEIEKDSLMNISIMTFMVNDAVYINSKLTEIRDMVLLANEDWNGSKCISAKKELKVGCKIKFLKNYDKRVIPLKSNISKKIMNKIKKDITTNINKSDFFISDQVSNGEEGWIQDIETLGKHSNAIKVCTIYPSNKRVCIGYEHIDCSHVTISYCTTVHGKLGDQEEICIVYMGNEKNIGWVDNKLLYTACSRARKKLYIIGIKHVITNDSFNKIIKYRNMKTSGKKYNNLGIINPKKQFEIMSQYIKPMRKSDITTYIDLIFSKKRKFEK